MLDKSVVKSILVGALVGLVLLVLYGGSRAGAQQGVSATQEPIRTVTVNGSGTVSASPDQATIRLGVRTQGERAAEATEQNNSQMQALLDALAQAGVASRDIQTSDFSIWPQYRYDEEGPSTITGYEVSNSVTVTVRDLENFGRTLDAVIRAGGNEVGSIQFGFNDPDALLDQAREKAMAQARHKATQLAELGEVQLGRVVTINEAGGEPPPIIMREVEAVAADEAVPIESGASTVSATVQVTFELVP